MSNAYTDWRRGRSRRRWRRTIARLSEPDLEEQLEELEIRLRYLGAGSRGLREAKDGCQGIAFGGATGVYPGPLEHRIEKVHTQWQRVLYEVSYRHDELQAERYRRLRARGEVDVTFHKWHPTQPSASELVHEPPPDGSGWD
jgi:hypothetical protein